LIVTVTLNPAVDEEYLVPEFRPGGWFRASRVQRSPGGKGINVSLVLKQLGLETAAMGFLAGFSGEYVRDFLRKAQITTNFLHVRGETRTNVYIVDEVGKVETGLAEPGPYISEDEIARFLSNYERILKRTDLVVLGGSLPPGIPQDFYCELIRIARQRDIPTFIDAAGAPLLAALEEGPTYAKVDQRFMGTYEGVALNSLDNLIEAVTRVHSLGIDWVIASYRTYGNVFFTAEGIFLAEFDRKGIVSMFGSGESLVAGLILAGKEGMDTKERILFGMAAALENALHVEKGVKGRAAVEKLIPRIRFEKLS
jgi:1-phosphofructokinase family hexose kinase